MTIKVLGSGCAKCHKLYEETLKAVKEMGKDYEVEYITDIEVMLGYGIMSSPTLMAGDKILSQGRVLRVKDIINLLEGLEVECESCCCKDKAENYCCNND